MPALLSRQQADIYVSRQLVSLRVSEFACFDSLDSETGAARTP